MSKHNLPDGRAHVKSNVTAECAPACTPALSQGCSSRWAPCAMLHALPVADR